MFEACQWRGFMNRINLIVFSSLRNVLFSMGGFTLFFCCLSYNALGETFRVTDFDRLNLVGSDLEVEVRGSSKESALISIEVSVNGKPSSAISFQKKGRLLLLKQNNHQESGWLHDASIRSSNGNNQDSQRNLASLSRPRVKISSPPLHLEINILKGNILLNQWEGPTQSSLIEGKLMILNGTGPFSGSLVKGDIQIKKFQGNVDLDLNQGDVIINNFEGNSKISLMKGHVKVNKFIGNLDLMNYLALVNTHQISGDVQFENYKGDLKLVEMKGSVHGKVQDGNVWVDLQNESDLRIEAGTGRTTVKTNGLFKLNLNAEGAEIIVPEGIDVGRSGHQKFVRSSIGVDVDENGREGGVIDVKSVGGMIIVK